MGNSEAETRKKKRWTEREESLIYEGTLHLSLQKRVSEKETIREGWEEKLNRQTSTEKQKDR